MKIKLITVGKTEEDYLITGINKYISRLKHYISFELITIPATKTGTKSNINLIKELEGREILKNISKTEFVVLLDEKGATYTSEAFAEFIQKRMNTGIDLAFIIGGPFGFSDEVYAQTNQKIALSQMTFSHQMVRLFFIEQLYRSCTILKGEKYHHS